MEAPAGLFGQLTVLVVVALLGPMLAATPRVAVPAVIGELVAGAAIGTTGGHWLDVSMQPYPALYAIGFAMLMFGAGTHVDLRSPTLRSGLRRGILALVITGALAAVAAPLVAALTSSARPALLAILLAGSSAAIAFPIIEERGLRGAKVEFLVAWVAVSDAATVVVMPLTLGGGASVARALIGDAAVIAIGLVALVATIQIRQRRHRWTAHLIAASVHRGWSLQLRLSMLLLLGLSAVAAGLGASTLLAGFVAGIVLVRLHESERLAVQFSGLANGFFVPLFFVLLGARLDLRAMFTDPHAIALAMTMAVGATVIHAVASLITAPGKDRWVPGLAASAQMGLPAAAASIGLSGGLLTPATASALVAAGCLTLIPATIGSGLLGRTTVAPSATGSTAGG